MSVFRMILGKNDIKPDNIKKNQLNLRKKEAIEMNRIILILKS